MKINWNEASTKRGAIWLTAAVIGVFGWWFEKDVTPILLLAGAVAGGIGVTIPDNNNGE